ncbi:hypothetical protein PENSPDRAFT_270476 [Peniophora sp. CONT]|nr:hypothetical protein PENSPDRAFT_270476 [Peniophora sp. CONT]
MVGCYGLVAACFVVNVASLNTLHGRYEEFSDSCVPYAAMKYQGHILAILVTDLSLVGAMLIGLYRTEEARRQGVTRYLYHQGWLWMALIIVAEVPSVVLAALNRYRRYSRAP